MAFTLLQMRDSVARKLRNYDLWINHKTVGDGVQTVFVLPRGNVATVATVLQLTATVDGDTKIIANASPSTISAKTVANPTECTTTAAHNLHTGDLVTIANGTGGTNINGTWVVTVTSTTTFTIPVNVTNSTITVQPSCTELAQYSVNAIPGIVTFVTAPADGNETNLFYECKMWTDADANEAINEAIRYFAPRFPYEDGDVSLTAGTALEYEVPAAVGSITHIQIGNSTDGYKDQKNLQHFHIGGKRYIKFPRTPGSGTIRILHVAPVVSLSTDADTTATAKVDDLIRDPVVSYATGLLLRDVIAQKVRDSAFIPSEAANPPKLWDVLSASNALLTDAERIADKVRATPRLSRS